ncbi:MULTISPECIES: hypothetical protein [Sporolactobacillus]|uniref:Small, acid-soluble spore protein L n=2 Tax=Sporolactobacillus TaxID=2077 RepID=A0A4Y1ZHZ7_9BACL|nr:MULTISPECIES: hypothetical protein [Sporolactobacillus]BBN99486.1 hypothetical protein St703_21910 [Sporolactobacillus terrae]GAY78593.1 hypothetical protein NBRC111894_4147 [Sporolactobacillus inulinus]
MSEARRKEYRSNKGVTASSVTPSGRAKDDKQAPVSKLEERARKNK